MTVSVSQQRSTYICNRQNYKKKRAWLFLPRATSTRRGQPIRGQSASGSLASQLHCTGTADRLKSSKKRNKFGEKKNRPKKAEKLTTPPSLPSPATSYFPATIPSVSHTSPPISLPLRRILGTRDHSAVILVQHRSYRTFVR